jgi:ParB-like chromosome segregation protein Spo0J
MPKHKEEQTNAPTVHCKHTRMEPIENLREHPKNPSQHSDTQVALLAKNIRHLGWRHPILVSGLTGFIVAGHARLQAARVLNLAAVPVDVQDFDTQADEMAYLIADNKIAELAEINSAVLKDLLEMLDDGSRDMDLTGFSAKELENMMTQTAPPEKIETLSPIRKLHVLITMNANAGLEMLPELEALAEKHSAEIHHGGN